MYNWTWPEAVGIFPVAVIEVIWPALSEQITFMRNELLIAAQFSALRNLDERTCRTPKNLRSFTIPLYIVARVAQALA